MGESLRQASLRYCRHLPLPYIWQKQPPHTTAPPGYSVLHFLRLFKYDTGYTPHDFLTALRMYSAKNMGCRIIDLKIIGATPRVIAVPSYSYQRFHSLPRNHPIRQAGMKRHINPVFPAIPS